MIEYNKCPAFLFSENYMSTYEPSSFYNDVLIHTGSTRKIEWENCLAVKYIDDNAKVIMNSNHFLSWPHRGEPGYNETHKIFDNLFYNYYDIVNKTKLINCCLDNDITYIWLLDAFSFSNSGHNLSECLDKASYIINSGYKNALIPKGFKDKHNFKLIELLLPDVNFTELDFDSIYYVKNIIIIPDCFFQILKHPYLIDILKNKIIENYSEMYDDCKNKKLILMKTNRNKTVFLNSTQLICEDVLLELEKNDFINIIPEDTDIFKLAVYLLFAKTIIISTGSVMYTNKIFFNLDANLIWIGQQWTLNHTNDHILSSLLKCIFTDSLFLNKDEILPKIKEFDI
jgi:hypothetical protein